MNKYLDNEGLQNYSGILKSKFEEYARKNHTHNYSPLDHNHDSIYSKVSHNHSGVYAPLTHSHVSDDINSLDMAKLTLPLNSGVANSGVNSIFIPYRFANVFETLPAECILVEYSRDGGATWINYEEVCGAYWANNNKRRLFSYLSLEGANFIVGAPASSAESTDSPDNMLRVTVDLTKGNHSTYFQSSHQVIGVSTAGSQNCQVEIELRDVDSETWVRDGKYYISGWTGYNYIPFKNCTLRNQHYEWQYNIIRYTFTQSGNNNPGVYHGLCIGKIFMFATNIWGAANCGYSYTGQTINRNIDFESRALNTFDDFQTNGNVYAWGFVRFGGTSSQFLKADGSVDSNAYLPLTGGTLSGDVNTKSFLPTTDKAYALGSSSLAYLDVYASNVRGQNGIFSSDYGGGGFSTTSVGGGLITISDMRPSIRLAPLFPGNYWEMWRDENGFSLSLCDSNGHSIFPAFEATSTYVEIPNLYCVEHTIGGTDDMKSLYIRMIGDSPYISNRNEDIDGIIQFIGDYRFNEGLTESAVCIKSDGLWIGGAVLHYDQAQERLVVSNVTALTVEGEINAHNI